MSHEHDLLAYRASWKNKPRPQVVEEILSFAMETRRVPDTYFLEINPQGKLVDPAAGELVESSILKEPNPYDKEYLGFRYIENWAAENGSGFIVWVSPPYPRLYPVSKIIVSEIEKDREGKRLLNRAIVLDIDAEECLKLAKEFCIYSSINQDIGNPEDLRPQPITLDLLNKDEWQLISTHLLKNLKTWEAVKLGQDIKIKEQARPKAEAIYSKLFENSNYRYWLPEERRDLLSIFGDRSGSCSPANTPQGAFDALLTTAAQNERSFPCPKCKSSIPSGLGITRCPHCGITKEEVGNSCD